MAATATFMFLKEAIPDHHAPWFVIRDRDKKFSKEAQMDHRQEIFLINCRYVAARNHELIDGKKLVRTILERSIVVYRGTSGRSKKRNMGDRPPIAELQPGTA